MPKRKLENLPKFIEDRVSIFSKEPKCFSAEGYHIFTHKGVEVQLVFQRSSSDKIKGPGLFDKGDLK